VPAGPGSLLFTPFLDAARQRLSSPGIRIHCLPQSRAPTPAPALTHKANPTAGAPCTCAQPHRRGPRTAVGLAQRTHREENTTQAALRPRMISAIGPSTVRGESDYPGHWRLGHAVPGRHDGPRRGSRQARPAIARPVRRAKRHHPGAGLLDSSSGPINFAAAARSDAQEQRGKGRGRG